MRTRSDLEYAFALLERTADSYAFRHDADAGVDIDAHAETHADVMELVHPAPPTHGHARRVRIRLAAGLAVAAAAVACVAVVVGHQGGGAGHNAPAAGGTGPTFDLRTVPFSVKHGSGFTLTNLQVDEASVTGDLYSRTQHFQFGLSPSDASIRPTGQVQVDVNGKRGYYTAGGDSAIHKRAVSGTNAPSATPSDSYARAVTWEYQPDAWALLTSQGMPDLGKLDLLRAARALQFDDSAAAIRVPLRFESDPLGGRLQRVFAADSIVDTEKPPFRLTGQPSETEVQYAIGDGNFVGVALFAGTHWEKSGSPVTVAGRRAYFDDGAHSLTVDEGNGRYLEVSVEHDDPAPGRLPRVTLEELRSVVSSVRLAAADRSDWFDARTALP